MRVFGVRVYRAEKMCVAAVLEYQKTEQCVKTSSLDVELKIVKHEILVLISVVKRYTDSLPLQSQASCAAQPIPLVGRRG